MVNSWSSSTDSLHEFFERLLALGHPSYSNQRQLAANLAFLANDKFGKDTVDRTRFELLLDRSQAQSRDDEWQLILIYHGNVFVSGDGVASMDSVLDGLLWASVSAVTSALS